MAVTISLDYNCQCSDTDDFCPYRDYSRFARMGDLEDRGITVYGAPNSRIFYRQLYPSEDLRKQKASSLRQLRAVQSNTTRKAVNAMDFHLTPQAWEFLTSHTTISEEKYGTYPGHLTGAGARLLVAFVRGFSYDFQTDHAFCSCTDDDDEYCGEVMCSDQLKCTQCGETYRAHPDNAHEFMAKLHDAMLDAWKRVSSKKALSSAVKSTSVPSAETRSYLEALVDPPSQTPSEPVAAVVDASCTPAAAQQPSTSSVLDQCQRDEARLRQTVDADLRNPRWGPLMQQLATIESTGKTACVIRNGSRAFDTLSPCMRLHGVGHATQSAFVLVLKIHESESRELEVKRSDQLILTLARDITLTHTDGTVYHARHKSSLRLRRGHYTVSLVSHTGNETTPWKIIDDAWLFLPVEPVTTRTSVGGDGYCYLRWCRDLRSQGYRCSDRFLSSFGPNPPIRRVLSKLWRHYGDVLLTKPVLKSHGKYHVAHGPKVSLRRMPERFRSHSVGSECHMMLPKEVTSVFDVMGLTDTTVQQRLMKSFCMDGNSDVRNLVDSVVQKSLNKVVENMSSDGSKPKIKIDMVLTTDEQRLLETSYPEFRIVFKQDKLANHAFAWASRILETQLCLSDLNYNPKYKPVHPNKAHVVDVGGNFCSHIKSCRIFVHSCCPILSHYDALRESVRVVDIASQRLFPKPNDAMQHRRNHLLTTYRNAATRGLVVCQKPAQRCNIRAPNMMFIHSTYDMTLTDIADAMEKHGSLSARGVFIFSPEMLLTEGEGLIKHMNAHYLIDKAKNTITFSFTNDPSLNYHHRLDTYFSLVKGVSLRSSSGSSLYYVQLLTNRNGVQFFRIDRNVTMAVVPPSRLAYKHWLPESQDKVVITYYDYNILSNTLSGSMQRKSLVVKKRLVDELRRHVYKLSDNKFNPQELYNYAVSVDTRVIINGVNVLQPEPSDTRLLQQVTHAVYLEAYVNKYNDGKVDQTVTDEIKRMRNLKNGWAVVNFFRALGTRVGEACRNLSEKINGFLFFWATNPGRFNVSIENAVRFITVDELLEGFTAGDYYTISDLVGHLADDSLPDSLVIDSSVFVDNVVKKLATDSSENSNACDDNEDADAVPTLPDGGNETSDNTTQPPDFKILEIITSAMPNRYEPPEIFVTATEEEFETYIRVGVPKGTVFTSDRVYLNPPIAPSGVRGTQYLKLDLAGVIPLVAHGAYDVEFDASLPAARVLPYSWRKVGVIGTDIYRRGFKRPVKIPAPSAPPAPKIDLNVDVAVLPNVEHAGFAHERCVDAGSIILCGAQPVGGRVECAVISTSNTIMHRRITDEWHAAVRRKYDVDCAYFVYLNSFNYQNLPVVFDFPRVQPISPKRMEAFMTYARYHSNGRPVIARQHLTQYDRVVDPVRLYRYLYSDAPPFLSLPLSPPTRGRLFEPMGGFNLLTRVVFNFILGVEVLYHRRPSLTFSAVSEDDEFVQRPSSLDIVIPPVADGTNRPSSPASNSTSDSGLSPSLPPPSSPPFSDGDRCKTLQGSRDHHSGPPPVPAFSKEITEKSDQPAIHPPTLAVEPTPVVVGPAPVIETDAQVPSPSAAVIQHPSTDNPPSETLPITLSHADDPEVYAYLQYTKSPCVCQTQKIVKAVGDGSCFYHSILNHHLFAPYGTVQALKRYLLTTLKLKSVTGTIPEGVRVHLKNLYTVDGLWADQAVIRHVADLFSVPFCIHGEEDTFFCIPRDMGENVSFDDHVCLSNRNNVHFDFIQCDHKKYRLPDIESVEVAAGLSKVAASPLPADILELYDNLCPMEKMSFRKFKPVFGKVSTFGTSSLDAANSAIEYVEYLRVKVATLQTNYHHFCNSLPSDLASRTAVERLRKDSKNIGVIMNDRWVLKPRVMESWEYGFDGEKFVRNLAADGEDDDPNVKAALLSEPVFAQKDKYIMVTKDTVLLQEPRLYEATKDILWENFRLPDVGLVQGVPGCGKTTYIINKHTPSEISCVTRGKRKIYTVVKYGDLVLTSTREAASDIRDRITKKYGYASRRQYSTVDSYLLNRRNMQFDVVYIDEALMQHAGIIAILCHFTQCRKMILLGDKCQIPFINRIPNIPIRLHLPTFVPVVETLSVSHRCPVDVAARLSPLYEGGMQSTNHVNPSMRVTRCHNYSQVPRQGADVYLTFTKTDKLTLQSNGYSPVFTVNEAQGKDYKNVFVVRLSHKEKEPIFLDQSQALVSMSRHSKSLVYYTPILTDELSRKILRLPTSADIQSASTLPDVKNKKPLSSGYLPPAHCDVSLPCAQPDLGSVADLQTWFDKLLPGDSLADQSFDQMFVHTHDLEINMSDCTFSTSSHVGCGDPLPHMKPVLRTSMAPIRKRTLYETFLGYYKRNDAVPELQDVVDEITLVDELVDNFFRSFVPPCASTVLQQFMSETIEVSSRDIDNWASAMHIDQKDLSLDSPFWQMELNKYKFMNKRSVKPALDGTATTEYKAVQTICYQEKYINALFCPVFRKLTDRFLSVLGPRFKVFTQCTSEDFAASISEIITPRELANSDLETLEIDISKYDKSQGKLLFEIEMKIYERLGVPKLLLVYWRYMHEHSILKDYDHRFTARVNYQRKSGDAATFIGNTLVLMSVVAALFDMDDVVMGCFAGDDSLLVGCGLQHDRSDLCARVFNLESKFFNYSDSLYFCSKFLIPLTPDSFALVPDPLKLVCKLGRSDLVNPEHVSEYVTSLRDLMGVFKDARINAPLSRAISSRYVNAADLDSEFAIIALHNVIYTDQVYNLWEVPQDEELSYDPSRPKIFD